VLWFDEEDEYEGLEGGYRFDDQTKKLTDQDGDEITWQPLTAESAERLDAAGMANWFTGDMAGDVLANPSYEEIGAVLEGLEIPENQSRTNVKRDDDQVITGMCLGIVNGRGNGIIVGQETKRFDACSRCFDAILTPFKTQPRRKPSGGRN